MILNMMTMLLLTFIADVDDDAADSVGGGDGGGDDRNSFSEVTLFVDAYYCQLSIAAMTAVVAAYEKHAILIAMAIILALGGFPKLTFQCVDYCIPSRSATCQNDPANLSPWFRDIRG